MAAELVTGFPTLEQLFGGSIVSPLSDPHSVYRCLRREEPVTRIALGDGETPGYLVTRYDDARAVLGDAGAYSSSVNGRGIGIVVGRTVIEMDGPAHLRHRNLVTPALSPRALRQGFEEKVVAIAHELVDAIAGRGAADLVAEFTFTYPLRVFCEILGLPVDDYEAVHNWSIDLTHIADDPPRGFAASQTLAEYLAPHLEKRRAEPSGDLISRLAHAEVEGERLSDEEVISFLRLLVIAGAETTYHLIGSALFALLTHREQLERVRADRSLLRAALDETLRWESPIGVVTREAPAATQLSGVDIPEGAQFLVAIGSANRDESRFEAPERFDLSRTPNEHLAFGFGKHYCAGSRLAYLEARVALDVLLERLPDLRLDPEQACEIQGLAFRGPDRLPVLFGS